MNSTVQKTTESIMSSSSLDPAKVGQLALQIVELLSEKDSATRQRAIQAAMVMLGETAQVETKEQDKPSQINLTKDSSENLAVFFNRDGDFKPADNVQLCAAYHYSVYGNSAFTVAEIKALALDAGVVLPDRVDMTLRKAVMKGKKLFLSTGANTFKPTAAGGMHFAEKWKVKPGKTEKTTSAKGNIDA